MTREVVKTLDQVEAEFLSEKQPQTSDNKRDAPKTLVVERIPGGGLLRVVYTAGGEVPDELKGQFTQKRIAEAAISNYLTKQEAVG
jgi:hypothetical protein